jgi:hypothetical protein
LASVAEARPALTGRGEPIHLLIFSRHVEIDCADERARAAIRANYEALLLPSGSAAGADTLRYLVRTDPASGHYLLSGSSGPGLRASTLAGLVFQLEKAITVALQERRPDLLFLHAAALERDGGAYVFAGESGHGKSTTAWGLLHHGFSYLSDELSPVDPGTLEVLPYPHALCLKQRPPAAYPLPVDVLDLGATIHVPVRSLPRGVPPTPCRAKALLFVRHRAHSKEPQLHGIGTAQAAAQLYVSTLNALAHDARGLDAVLRVVRHIPCFAVEGADLGRTCELISRLKV